MKSNDQMWARVGKWLTAVGLVFGVLLSGIELRSKLHGPDVVAVVDSQLIVFSPKIRDRISASYTREDLSNILEEGEKNKESGSVTVLKIKALLVDKPRSDVLASLNFDILGAYTSAWHVVVQNDSGDVAKEVKLVLPGTGKADFGASAFGSYFDPTKKPTEWTKELALGTIPAHGHVDMLIWLDQPMVQLSDENTAVLHSEGEGSVQKMQHLYGWFADAMMIFDGLPAYMRIVIFLFVFVLAFGLIRLVGRTNSQASLEAVTTASKPGTNVSSGKPE